jgi:hypothetical protein
LLSHGYICPAGGIIRYKKTNNGVGENMICPNCGNMVADGRTTCQSCGSMMPQQSPYASYSDHRSYSGTEQQAGYGQPGAPYGVPPKKSRKGLMVIAVIVIIMVIAIAAVGFVLSKQGVQLKIKNYELNDIKLTVLIKNEGTEDAMADKIVIRCNGVEVHDWPGDDIPAGEEQNGEIELNVQPWSLYLLEKIEIIYDGSVMDTIR